MRRAHLRESVTAKQLQVTIQPQFLPQLLCLQLLPPRSGYMINTAPVLDGRGTTEHRLLLGMKLGQVVGVRTLFSGATGSV